MQHGGNIYGKHIAMDYSVNLNPLGIPEEILLAGEKASRRYGVYPDPAQEEVRRSIADLEMISPDAVLAGNGASELLLAVVRAVGPKRALLFEPVYGGYEYTLASVGCRIRHVMTEAGTLPFGGEEEAKEAEEFPEIVFICDPSNPMGRNVDDKKLRGFLDRMNRRGTKVVLDESFLLMSDKASDVSVRRRGALTGEHGNLFIVRSLTKILASPGIRMGYVISAPENIAAVKRQLPEWNLSATAEEAIKAGCRLLKESAWIDQGLRVIREERAYLMREVSAMGFAVYESEAPYFCFRGPEGLYDALLKQGILIRDCANFRGLSKGIYRVAVKDHASNAAFCRKLREVCADV